MAKRVLNIEESNRTRAYYMAHVALLAIVVACFPSAGNAQEKPRRVSVITLGTTKEKVDSILGNPRSGWTINCLCRSMYVYSDGTKIIFVDGCAISVSPNGLAEGRPDGSIFFEHNARLIIIEPMVLRGIPMDGPTGEIKRQVEECFFFAPPVPINFVPPPHPWHNPPPGHGNLFHSFCARKTPCER